jgi:FixJ family two-component response regulator
MTSPPRLATIHVVDDESVVRTSIGRLLGALGYEVRLYGSAAEFLARPPKPERGCVLLDVQMPGLSGPELQDQLTESGCLLPVIFLSGHGDIPMSVRAIKAGAEDFLAKPARKEVLQDAIGRALLRYDETHERNARMNVQRQHALQLTRREREPGREGETEQADCARTWCVRAHDQGPSSQDQEQVSGAVARRALRCKLSEAGSVGARMERIASFIARLALPA